MSQDTPKTSAGLFTFTIWVVSLFPILFGAAASFVRQDHPFFKRVFIGYLLVQIFFNLFAILLKWNLRTAGLYFLIVTGYIGCFFVMGVAWRILGEKSWVAIWLALIYLLSSFFGWMEFKREQVKGRKKKKKWHRWRTLSFLLSILNLLALLITYSFVEKFHGGYIAAMALVLVTIFLLPYFTLFLFEKGFRSSKPLIEKKGKSDSFMR